MDFRYQIISALELLHQEGAAVDLSSYLGEQHQSEYQKAKDLWQKIPTETRENFLWNQLKALRSKEDFSGVVDIHPAWLLKPLERESPRVIGVILRHLPSKHVRYLLEHLPKRVTLRLPKLMESFYVSSEILTLVRRRFERHFHPMHLSRSLGQYDFDHIHYLKSEEMDGLIRDLGLSELALSMVKTSKRIVHIVLNRLGVRDAKALVQRIKEYQHASPHFCREARYTVLELGKNQMGVEAFLRELGTAALAKSFGAEHESLCHAVSQKMSPDQSYLFKRYVDNAKPMSAGAQVQRRQEWTLKHLADLSQAGLLDPQWAEGKTREAA